MSGVLFYSVKANKSILHVCALNQVCIIFFSSKGLE